MSAALPVQDACCVQTCDDVTVQNIPGPAGSDGAAGAAGAAGVSAYTLLTLAFTMPAEGAGATATVGSTAWITAGQIVYIAGLGYLTATTILSGTTFTATNPENTASGTYASNAAPGTIAAIGSKVSPAGIQGPAGTVSAGTLVGDVTGTIGANELTLNATLGALPVGDGSKAQSFAKGTDGEILCSDAAAALDLDWKPIIPSTGAANLADNRLLRLDGATGLPIPLQSSLVTVTDTGAIRADGSGGNARGTDAVDLQVTRGANTQVASGTRATICGGQNNTASNTEATICGGDGNTASAAESFVGGGNGNTASGTQSTVCGGFSNTASALYSTVSGGVGGTASGQASTVSGGNTQVASAYAATIAGGEINTASGQYSAVLGGANNISSGDYSVATGVRVTVPLFGQKGHSSGMFASNGDCQVSELVWRRATTDATANVELFLDGSASRAVVPTSKSWMFSILLIARSDAGLDSIYTSVGVVRNNAGTVSVNAVTTTEVYDGIGLPATPVTVDADDPNNALRIQVTGVAATNIRWVAFARLVEVAY